MQAQVCEWAQDVPLVQSLWKHVDGVLACQVRPLLCSTPAQVIFGTVNEQSELVIGCSYNNVKLTLQGVVQRSSTSQSGTTSEAQCAQQPSAAHSAVDSGGLSTASIDSLVYGVRYADTKKMIKVLQHVAGSLQMGGITSMLYNAACNADMGYQDACRYAPSGHLSGTCLVRRTGISGSQDGMLPVWFCRLMQMLLSAACALHRHAGHHSTCLIV